MPHSKSVPPIPVHARVQTPNNHPASADFHSPAKVKIGPTPTDHRTRQSHLSSSVSRDRTWRGTSCMGTPLFWMISDDSDNSNNRKKILLDSRSLPPRRVITMVPASMQQMPPFVPKVGRQPVFWSFVSSSRSSSGPSPAPSSMSPWIQPWMNCCGFFPGLC